VLIDFLLSLGHISDMPVVRRLCSLLVVLALALGAAHSAAQAGNMTVSMAMDSPMTIAGGMDRPMPDGCNGCGDMANAPICVQAVCSGLAAVLPRSDVPAPAVSSAFAAAPAQRGAGRSGLPDPYPPKPNILA